MSQLFCKHSIVQERKQKSLLKKYNVPAPRYTSYPTVPYWDNDVISQETWKELVKDSFLINNSDAGISLYIHLPFCESLCTYCGCNTRITINHKVENPYIMALLSEWSMYLELFEIAPHIKQIHLGGGTPTFFSAQNLAELIKGILTSSVLCKDAELSFEAHPANTSDEHLKILFELGFTRLSLGIQDFDEAVQKCINRIQTVEQVKHITEKAREIGYQSVNYDLIYGLPLQTVTSMTHTLEKVMELKPDRVAFYSYAHVPWLKPGQRSFSEKDLPGADLKNALYEMGRTAFENAGYVEIGMDHFALPGDALSKAMEQKLLYRNFMGYTSSRGELLIGLGVSSISDTGYAFAQNEKTVEKYYERIGKNEFPVIKGHILSAEDLVLRRHILNTMCQGETSWANEDAQCHSLINSFPDLKEMEKDGLLNLYNTGLKVTRTGKHYLRNICMAFDARLREKNPGAHVFSNAV